MALIAFHTRLRLLLMIAACCCASAVFDSAHAQFTDNSTYCSKTAAIRVFLIDVTTQYDEIDKRIIERMLSDILTSAKDGDRLVIRTITDSHTKSERLIERCIPYCAVEGFKRWTECSDGVIRADREFARRDILGALRGRLAKFDDLKFSDIIRTISTVSVEEARSNQPLYLSIYSDLIENSDYMPAVSFFHYAIPYKIDNLRKMRLLASLKNNDVEVVGVGRAGTADRRPLNVSELAKVTDFWTAYFKESGAAKVRISQNPQ